MNKSAKAIGYIGLILMVYAIFCNLIAMTSGDYIWIKVCQIILIIFVLVYTTILYKIPHGNFLQIMIGLTCLLFILKINSNYGVKQEALEKGIQVNNDGENIVYMVSILFMGYMAGRLNRLKENQILFGVILVAQYITTISAITKQTINGYTFMQIVTYCTPFIITLLVAASYFLRYNEHIAAGKAADQKKEEVK